MVIVSIYTTFVVYKDTKRNGFWKLYLDDERNIPNHYCTKSIWYICRSSDDAKQMVLKHGIPKFISFDHDLGGNDTSMVFLKWLANEYYTDEKYNKNLNSLNIPQYVIHSQNPVGAKNIESYIECWKKAYNTP